MLILALTLTLSPTQIATGSDEQAAYDEAFEASFRSSFRTRFLEACASSAKSTAANKIDPTPICSCISDQLLTTKSVSELRRPIAEEVLRAHAMACMKEHLL